MTRAIMRTHLISNVQNHCSFGMLQSKANEVYPYRDPADEQDHDPQPTEPGPVARVSQLGQEQPRYPGEQYPLVPHGYHARAAPDGPQRGDDGQDEEGDEVEVARQVGEELDERNATVLVAEREGENYPDRRAEQEGDEYEEYLPLGPGDRSFPHLESQKYIESSHRIYLTY